MGVSTLAQLEVRVSARLADAANALWPLTLVDEALRTALSEYSAAIPQAMEGILILPGTGREIALDSFANLTRVLDVWWPYDTLTEVWPPNQVAGFRVWWDDARPVLLLASKTANQPQASDTIRVWYTRPQTIASLDSATTTSVFPNHESSIVNGAAGFAASMALVSQLSSVKVDPHQVVSLHTYAADRLKEFRASLAALAGAGAAPSFGPPYGEGWGIDKWDANRG